MKIAVISPNQLSLQEIGKSLSSHALTLIEGGKSALRAVAEGRHDAILVDGMCHDANELDQIEHVTTNHPKTAVVLLCSNHSSPEFLLHAMRAGVREILTGKHEIAAAISRIEQRLAPTDRAGRILAFVSAKGGDGSTFLATNLGHQLALQGKRVLLVDLNLQFGNALSSISELRAATTVVDAAQDAARLDASFLVSCTTKVAPGFEILPAAVDPLAAVEIKPECLDALLHLAVTQYDFVLLDTPRDVSELTIKAWDRADALHVVLQKNLHSLCAARKLQAIFQSLSYGPDKMQLVVNRTEDAGEIDRSDVVRSLNAKHVRFVPNGYREALKAVNHGQPLAHVAPRSAVLLALNEWVQSILPKAKAERPGLLGRLLKRA